MVDADRSVAVEILRNDVHPLIARQVQAAVALDLGVRAGDQAVEPDHEGAVVALVFEQQVRTGNDRLR